MTNDQIERTFDNVLNSLSSINLSLKALVVITDRLADSILSMQGRLALLEGLNDQ